MYFVAVIVIVACRILFLYEITFRKKNTHTHNIYTVTNNLKRNKATLQYVRFGNVAPIGGIVVPLTFKNQKRIFQKIDQNFSFVLRKMFGLTANAPKQNQNLMDDSISRMYVSFHQYGWKNFGWKSAFIIGWLMWLFIGLDCKVKR